MAFGLRSMLLGALAFAGLSSRGEAYPIDLAPHFDLPDFFVTGGSSGRSYGTTRGGRAHQRWKKARASGRHDFRRTLRHG
jgi:hypothetical protein